MHLPESGGSAGPVSVPRLYRPSLRKGHSDVCLE